MAKATTETKLYFSDHFNVAAAALKQHGAFNISLISDLPLFIDPFLLFNSKKAKYKQLHRDIIKYLVFLKGKAKSNQDKGTLKAWFVFKEVYQNWLGFSLIGNKGSALGMDFGQALNNNLNKIFNEFGREKVTKGSHLEKLCLIKDGIGRDNVSDFVTNLIKEYLLEYTQDFAKKYIDQSLRHTFRVPRTRFNYETEVWEEGTFELPQFNNDFVLLTPRDLLTREDIWINRIDLLDDFERIPGSISNDQLRFQVNNYLQKELAKYISKDKEPTKKERFAAAFATLREFPQLIDYYIKYKEEHGDDAITESDAKVIFSEHLYIRNVTGFIAGLKGTKFYSDGNSYDEAKKKIGILKDYIENNDGYKMFYDKGQRIKGEKDLQLLFGLVCHESTTFDVNREVNNGRGPVDAKLSKGSADKTLVEFKLAGNKKLEQNLLKQVEIYKKANKTNNAFKVIIYFSVEEQERVAGILKKLGMAAGENIILIDARSDNKISASLA